MMTRFEALTILAQNGKYLEDNYLDMTNNAIAVRLSELEEAIKFLKQVNGTE